VVSHAAQATGDGLLADPAVDALAEQVGVAEVPGVLLDHERRRGFPGRRGGRSVTSMRVRRTFAVAVMVLASVTWGASASAAPREHRAPAHHPILVRHTMSSCGVMDGIA